MKGEKDREREGEKLEKRERKGEEGRKGGEKPKYQAEMMLKLSGND